MSQTTLIECPCTEQVHQPKFIAVTGGPGAGKTALLEIARRNFCEHVAELPEAASIIFGGGFWRRSSIAARKAAQRAIFHVQRELERIVEEEAEMAVALCDRGTIDGAAYWPEDSGGAGPDFWNVLKIDRQEEMKRYSVVIHLHPPKDGKGFNHSNPLRIETFREAHEIDERIYRAWEGHPRRFFLRSEEDFMEKVQKAIQIIKNEIPKCCAVKS